MRQMISAIEMLARRITGGRWPRACALAFRAMTIIFVMAGMVAAAEPPTTLDVPPGFVAEIFASDPAITKPIQMNFDAAGRLWLVCSETYPQLKPGAAPSDKIFVLEDRDGDGRADTSTLFADQLLIPTGIEIGDSGAYVGQSTEVLHLADTDGDGKADRRRVVLSAFGTEDTHHLVHTFRYGPDGFLYFAQSIYIHSHVETPWGVRRLGGGGFWHYRADGDRLGVFVHGMVNTWGIAFDAFGQAFGVDNDTNSPIKFFLPGARFPHTPGETRTLPGIVQNKPKYCGAEFLSGRHFPQDFRGDFVTCDFRAHRVCRYKLEPSGAGFQAIEQEALASSQNVAFRPIDVKMGPDGALYVCDWYNPIINHGEVDFRDPRRDKTHGRIWRIRRKESPLLPRPRLVDASVEQLLLAQKAEEDWTRHFAGRILAERPKAMVVGPLLAWSQAERDETLLLRALWLFQVIDVPNQPLLARLLAANDGRVRAAAIRVLSHWRDRIAAPFELLRDKARDPHPLARMDAVRALAALGTTSATHAALAARELPRDPFLDYALELTARETEDIWLPQLSARLQQATDNSKLASNAGANSAAGPEWIFALLAVDAPEAAPALAQMFRRGLVPAAEREPVLVALGRLGGPAELRMVLDQLLAWLERPETNRAKDMVALLGALDSAHLLRNTRPAGDIPATFGRLLELPSEDVRRAAIRLIGVWNLEAARPAVEAIAKNKGDLSTRLEAIRAIGRLRSPAALEILEAIARAEHSPDMQAAVVAAMLTLDGDKGARVARQAIVAATKREELVPVMQAVLENKEGPSRLARALIGTTLKPELARWALQIVASSGRGALELEAAIAKAGAIAEADRPVYPEQLARIAKLAQERGDPARGQKIYQREKLRCVACHRIRGQGGLVGPDLTAIGTSAPADYLVESLLAPSKKIKENYHSLTIATTDGKVLTGIPVQQSEAEWRIRTSDDKLVTIAAREIEASKPGPSLMPTGVIDELPEQELLDLVRYLMELGKPGPYGPSAEQVARAWWLLGPMSTSQSDRIAKQLLSASNGPLHPDNPTGQSWERSLTANAGWVYLREYTLKPHAEALWAACQAKTEGGRFRLLLEPAGAARLFIAGKEIATRKVSDSVLAADVELPKGTSTLLVHIDLRKTGSFLKLRALPLDEQATLEFVGPSN